MKQECLFYTHFACQMVSGTRPVGVHWWHFQIRDHVTCDRTFYEVTKYKQDVQ